MQCTLLLKHALAGPPTLLSGRICLIIVLFSSTFFAAPCSHSSPLWAPELLPIFSPLWTVISSTHIDLIKVKMNLATSINWQKQLSYRHTHTKKMEAELILMLSHSYTERMKKNKSKNAWPKRNVLDTSSWFDCCWFSLSRIFPYHTSEKILTWHEIQQRRDPITNHFTCLSSISVVSPRRPRPPPPPPTTRKSRAVTTVHVKI